MAQERDWFETLDKWVKGGLKSQVQKVGINRIHNTDHGWWQNDLWIHLEICFL